MASLESIRAQLGKHAHLLQQLASPQPAAEEPAADGGGAAPSAQAAVAVQPSLEEHAAVAKMKAELEEAQQARAVEKRQTRVSCSVQRAFSTLMSRALP